MKPSRAVSAKAFRAAVLSGDADKARQVWEEKAHHYPSVLPMAWSCLVGEKSASDTDMERFLVACSTARTTPSQWRSRAACEALFRVSAGDRDGWTRRWAWARDQVRWKGMDHKALAIQLAYGSQAETSSLLEPSKDYRSRLKDVLSQTPYLPGFVWGLLGWSEKTREIALELPGSTFTTPEFRGGILALSCLASSLSEMSEPWLQGFLEKGLRVESDIRIGADVSHVEEEKQGAHRLAALLDMEAVDLYQLSRFARVDAYEDAFVGEAGHLKVDWVWGRAKAGAGEDPVAVASRFRAALMDSRLEPSQTTSTKKPRM